jgi:Na+/H+-translocating membrane pyrophosphatase
MIDFLSNPWVITVIGLLGLVFAAYLATWVLKQDIGNARMAELSQAIF